MSVFGTYARYYDLLYKDKDYTSEALFVESLLARHAPRARRRPCGCCAPRTPPSAAT